MRAWLLPAAAVIALALAAALGGPAVARGVRFAFLVAGAAPIGAAVLLAIARVTGADWRGLAPIAAPLPLLVPVAAIATMGAPPLPSHLAVWSNPLFVALRAALAVGALAFAAPRLGRENVAAVTLALFAALITPIATDWLLGTEPAHSVSAVGMMYFVASIAAACAVLLVTRLGGERMRGDLAKLLIAAALGLCYLTFMDYLITWYGNLPPRVPFYLARTAFPGAFAVIIAMVLGLFGPIGALTLIAGEPGRRAAGALALGGLMLWTGWWLQGGLVAALAGLVATAILGAALVSRGRAHG